MINILNLTKYAMDSNSNQDSYKKLSLFWHNIEDSISRQDFDNGYEYLKAWSQMGVELNPIISDIQKKLDKQFLEAWLNNEREKELKLLEEDILGKLTKIENYPTLLDKIQQDERFLFLVYFGKTLKIF